MASGGPYGIDAVNGQVEVPVDGRLPAISSWLRSAALRVDRASLDIYLPDRSSTGHRPAHARAASEATPRCAALERVFKATEESLACDRRQVAAFLRACVTVPDAVSKAL